ncbi:MAG TPA: hypothetical protein VNI57_04265, partial [Candidatus Saccharimonadales bacterium]|nr:hypothetical protein [Candidatus Saccharimonadales bacterium]
MPESFVSTSVGRILVAGSDPALMTRLQRTLSGDGHEVRLVDAEGIAELRIDEISLDLVVIDAS